MNFVNSAALQGEVKWNRPFATQDIDDDVGVGCVYNLTASRIRWITRAR